MDIRANVYFFLIFFTGLTLAGSACPENYCKNGGSCLFLEGVTVCVCQDGWTGTLCQIASANAGCGNSFFKCHDGNCIIERFQCDGKPQCPDKSDEVNCTHIVPSWCRGSFDYLCDDGQCVSADGQCDKFEDCQDGSDELYCGGSSNVVIYSNENKTLIYSVTFSAIALILLLPIIGILVYFCRHHQFNSTAARARAHLSRLGSIRLSQRSGRPTDPSTNSEGLWAVYNGNAADLAESLETNLPSSYHSGQGRGLTSAYCTRETDRHSVCSTPPPPYSALPHRHESRYQPRRIAEEDSVDNK